MNGVLTSSGLKCPPALLQSLPKSPIACTWKPCLPGSKPRILPYVIEKKLVTVKNAFFLARPFISYMCLISAAMMSWVGFLLTNSELFILFA